MDGKRGRDEVRQTKTAAHRLRRCKVLQRESPASRAFLLNQSGALPILFLRLKEG
jgi:hypothetical protein